MSTIDDFVGLSGPAFKTDDRKYPPVACILKDCAHTHHRNRCPVLGQCGAALMLDSACVGNYQVYERDNPVLEALVMAGKVRTRRGPIDQSGLRTVFVEPT